MNNLIILLFTVCNLGIFCSLWSKMIFFLEEWFLACKGIDITNLKHYLYITFSDLFVLQLEKLLRMLLLFSSTKYLLIFICLYDQKTIMSKVSVHWCEYAKSRSGIVTDLTSIKCVTRFFISTAMMSINTATNRKHWLLCFVGSGNYNRFW